MFCPNCGANNNTGQKFCRTCGLNLEKTAESLTEQLPNAEQANLLRQEGRLETLGNIAFGGLGIVLVMGVIAILYVIFTQWILTGTRTLTGVLLINFIIFATLAFMWVIFNESLKEKKKKINLNTGKELITAKDTGKLLDEGNFEPAHSVTEHSTELLYDKSRTKKLD